MPIFEYYRNHWRISVLLGAMVLGIAIGLTGAGTAAERTLAELGWRSRSAPVSGELHIVEIDAQSIAGIDHWPWQRSNHARLIDQLHRAGVASIAFDVDFSSRSTTREDAALGDALSRAGGKVVLPTFRQRAGGGTDGWTDSLPIGPLRDNSIAAAVSIQPDRDGYVRRAPIGIITGGLARPSLSAMIAGRGGSAGHDFPIDFALEPELIPRHSFIDIRDGRFDPSELAGKQVLVGGTAVEMGDRYVVPLHGVLPGVVVQALAAETLMRGIPRETGWPAALVPAFLLAWFTTRRRSHIGLVAAILASSGILFAASVASQTISHRYFEIVPALVVVLAAGAASMAMRMAAAVRHRLLHDSETGLPNRRALEETLRRAANPGLVTARVAGFDKIVATLGPAGTAELILRIRERIHHLHDEASIYRLEDRVLAWCCDDEEELRLRLPEIRDAMTRPVEVMGRRVYAILAFGYAQGKSREPSQLVANAALAAERARRMGTGWHMHQASDGEEADLELSLLGELDEAISQGQIEVLYQPKLDIAKERIGSVEALVRWRHPRRGYLRPDLFIPLAERNDRIAGLTLHVLEQTLADLGRWNAAGHPISGAINVSAKLLGSPAFTADLCRLVAGSKVSADRLILEVTESATMHDPEAAVAALNSFCDLGVSISMDDYGTGQSSLSYIKQLPLSELKIDRSFVQNAHRNPGDAVLVRSTVQLAHELGLKVVAEGIEEPECLSFIRSIGCDYGQGYLISRPVAALAIMDLLNGKVAEAA